MRIAPGTRNSQNLELGTLQGEHGASLCRCDFHHKDIRHGRQRLPNFPYLTTFRINTCKSVSKQSTLTTFRINTCEKPRGRGAPRVTASDNVRPTPAYLGRLLEGIS